MGVVIRNVEINNNNTIEDEVIYFRCKITSEYCESNDLSNIFKITKLGLVNPGILYQPTEVCFGDSVDVYFETPPSGANYSLPDEPDDYLYFWKFRFSQSMNWVTVPGTFQLTDEPMDEPIKLLKKLTVKENFTSDEFVTMTHGESKII